MTRAEPSRLRLLDAAVIGAQPGGSSGGSERPVLAAVRAARPVADRMDRADRARVAAVIVSHAGGGADHVAEIARHTAAGVSFASGSRLPVVGLDACGVFAALHVGWAATAEPAALALIVSFGLGEVGVFLVARGDWRADGAGCRPLPPAQAPAPAGAREDVVAGRFGAALALSLERGGIRGREVRRVASPGLAPMEAARVLREAGAAVALASSTDAPLGMAATAERALAAATERPPGEPTLLWARSPGGYVSGCVIGPD